MKVKILAALLILSACAPKIGDLNLYQKQFASKTKYMPSAEILAGKPAKIVVFKLEENNNQTAIQAALGDSMAGAIETILGKNKLGQIVDRKAAEKLKQEIALAEMNKTGSYKGPDIADYAISGSISNAGFTKKYVGASACFDPLSKSMKPVPARYEYTSEVAGNLKVYELPSLAVVQSFDLDGYVQRKENVQRDGAVEVGAISFSGKAAAAADHDEALVRKAGEDAVKNNEVDIKNFFGKTGYIMEKRSFEKNTIFKINLGATDGIKHGDKFEVTGQFESQNALTNQAEIEKRVITEGVVSEIIDPQTAWVIIKDEKKANEVRLGDVVRMKYKKGFFSIKATRNLSMAAGSICGAN